MSLFKSSQNGWCAVCGLPADHLHHVVYRQHCPAGTEWDVRNGLALCYGCHEAHHTGARRIRLDVLRRDNLAFAREVLGAAADDYLARRYLTGAKDGGSLGA